MPADTQERTPSHISTLNEKSLHADLKAWYAQPGDRFEVCMDGFIIDIVRDGLLVEIQTRSFAAIRRNLREFCIDIFTELYIWRGFVQCGEIILRLVAACTANPDEVPHVLSHLRVPLTHGPVQAPDPAQEAIRERALDLLGRILRSARDGLRDMENCHTEVPFSDWPTAEQERARALTSLIDHVATEVYFASGASERKRQDQAEEDQSPEQDRAERFYREAGPIMEELSETGLPSVTHHLVETIEFFIPLDPRGAFLRIGRIVRAGLAGGYHYESLAADLIVRLVERYLAEYRPLLREDAECRQTLIEILDAFVQVGWPSARRLTYIREMLTSTCWGVAPIWLVESSRT